MSRQFEVAATVVFEWIGPSEDDAKRQVLYELTEALREIGLPYLYRDVKVRDLGADWQQHHDYNL